MSEWKTVSTKLKIEDYDLLKHYVGQYNKQKNTTLTVNSFLYKMIQSYFRKKGK